MSEIRCKPWSSCVWNSLDAEAHDVAVSIFCAMKLGALLVSPSRTTDTG